MKEEEEEAREGKERKEDLNFRSTRRPNSSTVMFTNVPVKGCDKYFGRELSVGKTRWPAVQKVSLSINKRIII